MRTYSELSKLRTFEERLQYLLLDNRVGAVTFGYDRYLNQKFYSSPEWLSVRNKAILRDSDSYGVLDLGTPEFYIMGSIYVHHINPIRPEDFYNNNPDMFNLENLICTSLDTHNAIHFRSAPPTTTFNIRRKGDTIPWSTVF